MRKRLLLIAALAAAVLAGGLFTSLRHEQSVHAQGNFPVYLPNAATVTANTASGNNYFYTLLTGNITTFSLTPATGQQAAGVVTVIFQQDGTGSRTVGWATNIPATCTVLATANKFTVCQFYFDVVSNLWYAVSPSTAHN